MFGLLDLDFKKLLLIVLILALPLISLNLERKDAGTVKWYDIPVLYVVHPMQKVFTDFAEGVASTTSNYLNLLEIKKENRVLKEQLVQLKQELFVKEELVQENDRLKAQLDFQKTSTSKLMDAQVIGVDLFGEFRTLKINKGSANGLKKGMGVISRDGVVGYLLNTTLNFSTVLVLSDRNAVIDALVQRTRARGIVEGMGGDLCHLKYLHRTDDVQVGDLVVTSGFDGIFPKGFPLGTVTKVIKKNFGVTQTVEMNPVSDINRIEEVFVVIKSDS